MMNLFSNIYIHFEESHRPFNNVIDESIHSENEGDKNKSDMDEEGSNEDDAVAVNAVGDGEEEDEGKIAKTQRKELQKKKRKRQRAEDIVNAHKRARNEEHINSDSIENINPLPVTSVQDILEDTSDPTPGPSRQVLSDTNNIPPVEEVDDIAAGTVRGDNIYLGRQIWIKESAYETAMNKLDAAKFIRTMAFAIWGHEDLANRCVKQIEGKSERPLLEINKEAALKKHYSKYLKNRKCDSFTYRREQDKFNAYMGRAITSARNEVKKQNRKATNV